MYAEHLAVFFIGTLLGSFYNVIIKRLPEVLFHNWRTECQSYLDPTSPVISHSWLYQISLPRSHCPNCKRTIAWYDNIPIVSFIRLLGRCGHCHRPISRQYPVIEALQGVLTLACYQVWGLQFFGFSALILCSALVILSAIDLEHMILPDDITLPILWLGLLINHSDFARITAQDALWGAALGYLSLWSLYWLFRICTNKEGLGFGDFKLLALLGAWFGWQALPFIILSASLAGSFVGIFLIIIGKHKRQNPMPFGPFLAGAGGIYLFWQPSLILLTF